MLCVIILNSYELLYGIVCYPDLSFGFGYRQMLSGARKTNILTEVRVTARCSERATSDRE